MAPAEVDGDAAFRQARLAWHAVFVKHQLGVEQLSPRPRNTANARCEARCGSVWRSRSSHGTGVIRGVGAFASQSLTERGPPPTATAQLADEHGVPGPAFGQQVAHAIEHSVGIVAKPASGLRKRAALSQRVLAGVGEQRIGQWFQARLRAIRPWCGALP